MGVNFKKLGKLPGDDPYAGVFSCFGAVERIPTTVPVLFFAGSATSLDNWLDVGMRDAPSKGLSPSRLPFA